MNEGKPRVTKPDYLRHVDGLRGVSVLLVVLYHAWPSLLPGGFVGVDVFFVISGFLITRLILSAEAVGSFRYSGFLVRRIRRLWPSFALVLMTTLGLGWILLEPDALVDLGRSALAALGFSSNWYFALTTDYFNEGLAQNFLLHSWSLAVEEQFYLIYPIVLIWLGGRPKRLLWALLVIWGLSFGTMLFGRPETGLFFVTHLRVWQLASGALLWLGVSHGLEGVVPPKLKRWLGLAGLVLLVLIGLLMPREVFWPSVVTVLPVLGAAMCIAFSWRGLEARWLVGLGLISYALYLWHWPLLKAFEILFPRAPDGAIAAVLLASVGVAWLAWRFVEEPVRRRRLLVGHGRLFGTFGVVTATLGLLAWQLHAHGGFADRFPSDIVAVAETGPDERMAPMICARGLERVGEHFDVPVVPSEDLPGVSVCWFGEGKPDLLYFGDSHLGAVQTGLALRADKIGSSGVFITLAACPPIPDARWSHQGMETLRQCDTIKALMLDMLATGQIKQTILVGHWDIYGGDLKTGLAEFNDVFERFVAKVSQQTELHIVLDVPTHDFDVPQALLRTRKFPWLGEVNWLSKAEHEAVREPYLTIMRDAETRGELVLHDPVPVFCPNDLCLAETKAGVLYYDASHVSQIGAELLLDALPGLPH